MKTTLTALLLALSPIMASAESETKLTKKIESLEKALRLQTLTTLAIRQDNYDLACRAQREAHLATHQAHVIDVTNQVDMQFAEICMVSRIQSQTNTPAWLKPAGNFEPAGIYWVN